MEILRAIAKVARQRLFANDELVATKSGHGDRLVGHRWHTDVNGIDPVEQGFESLEAANAAAFRVSLGLLHVSVA